MLHIIQVFDPSKDAWRKATVIEGNPLPQVREALGGRWTKSSGQLKSDMVAAFWNETNGRKVFVLAMPMGMPLDAAYRVAEAQP